MRWHLAVRCVLLVACGGTALDEGTSTLRTLANDASVPYEDASGGDAAAHGRRAADMRASAEGGSATVSGSDASGDAAVSHDDSDEGAAAIEPVDEHGDAGQDVSCQVPDGARAVGTTRCDGAGGSVERCEADAQWHPVEWCALQQRCVARGDSASCEVQREYLVGNADVDASWEIVASTNVMYAQKISVSEPAMLRALYVTSAVSAGGCDLALYADEGGSPGPWLTSVLNAPVEADSTAGRAVATRIELAPDAAYWVVAACSQSQAPAQIYKTQRVGEQAYVSSIAAGAPPPTMFPVEQASSEPNTAYSIFVRVRPLQP